MVRIYVDGVFDLFHYGHAETLGRIKKGFGPNTDLLVGVMSDADCAHYKKAPILTCDERCRSVAACRFVDEVIVGPWIIDQEFMERHAIDYVCHDGSPYPAPGMSDVYGYVKAAGKFIHVDRTPGISTSDIIARITSEVMARIREV